MPDASEQRVWKNWAAVLLPPGGVVLYALLDRWMPGPSAGGVAFLAVIIVAYFIFPKTKLSALRFVVGLLLALLAAYFVAGVGAGR